MTLTVGEKRFAFPPTLRLKQMIFQPNFTMCWCGQCYLAAKGATLFICKYMCVTEFIWIWLEVLTGRRINEMIKRNTADAAWLTTDDSHLLFRGVPVHLLQTGQISGAVYDQDWVQLLWLEPKTQAKGNEVFIPDNTELKPKLAVNTRWFTSSMVANAMFLLVHLTII